MGFKAKRKNVPVGRSSKAMILPSVIEIGPESTIAGNRLILSDPRGEISPEDLLEFFEEHVEPRFWQWMQERKAQT